MPDGLHVWNQAFTKRLGFRVAVTIRDHDCDTLGISMSAMRLPANELAIKGLAALDEKIKLPTTNVPPQALPLVYEEGTTVGPVPANP